MLQLPLPQKEEEEEKERVEKAKTEKEKERRVKVIDNLWSVQSPLSPPHCKCMVLHDQTNMYFLEHTNGLHCRKLLDPGWLDPDMFATAAVRVACIAGLKGSSLLRA